MSTSLSDPSRVASKKVNGDRRVRKKWATRSLKAVADIADTAGSHHILLFLIAFRLLNALTISTFFQPDEYFQSLEPAWRMAFGADSGAWITWEWREELRSAIHPSIFAIIYYLAHLVAEILRLTPATRADLLLAAPKTLQGVFAALGDYYTWQLTRRTFGRNSHQARAALALTVLSPWQWFCSTRTLSNCLETTLTVAALYNWPWQWSLTDRHAKYDGAGLRVRDDEGKETVDETTRLRRSLLLAAVATVLRPPNLLIWLCLTFTTCLKISSRAWAVWIPWSDRRILIDIATPSFLRATARERAKLLKESILCGSTILLLSVLVDRFFYQLWTFPPLKFIYFNAVQSLSAFYGENQWHYYFSQALPLLLTTALPFAIAGLYQSSSSTTESTLTNTVLWQFAAITCSVPSALSLISHKEVRFIYPLLPLLHLLAAGPLTQFFAPSLANPLRSHRNPSVALFKRLMIGLFILINATIGMYTTTIHARGVIDVLAYLRHQHETYYIPQQTSTLTAAFLMPCHSTPWRSHLVHHGISAWALTCEPPVHLSREARATFIDEADAFYADPLLWLRRNMSRQPPRAGRPILTRYTHLDGRGGRSFSLRGHVDSKWRQWPDYLIFFAQAEKTMEVALAGSGYSECWRGFNSHWHDDERRQGDVVAWCLFPERKVGKGGSVWLWHEIGGKR